MKSIVILLGLLLGQLTLAQSIFFKNLPQGQIQATGEGFTNGSRKYQVNFYRAGQFIKQILTNTNGTFSYTSPKNTFNHGDRMVVKVLQYRSDRSHWEKSWQYRSASVTPTPTPSPTPSIPYSKLKGYANQQARTVANRVAATYGARENFKYNFTIGFWQGYTDFKRWGANTFRGHQYYLNGLEYGKALGQKDGYNRGKGHGNGEGRSLGQTDAKKRFYAAVDRGQPDLTLNTPSARFNGFAGNYYVPTIEQKLSELESDFRYGLNRYYWDSDHYRLSDWDRSWTLAQIYRDGGDYRFVDSWFRAEYAFTEWQSNRLGGRYDKNLYRELGVEQRQTFQALFKETYNRVIEEKYYRVKTRRNYDAIQFGERYGVQIGKEMARQEGIRDGVIRTYQTASIQGFQDSFARAYEQAFNRIVNQYSQNPVIILDAVEIQTSRLPGAPISLIIKKITNVGGVDFTGPLKVSGQYLTATMRGLSVQLPALSTNKGRSLSFNNIARIKGNIPVDQNSSISVSLGNSTQTIRFVADWENTVAGHLGCQNSNENAQLHQYLVSVVKQEWENQKGTLKNLYKKELNESYLGRLVRVIEQGGTCGDRRQLVQDLSNIPGRANWVQFRLRERKKAFLAFVNRL